MSETATSKAIRLLIAMDELWRWLGQGFRDMFRELHLSIGYSVFVIGGGVDFRF